MTICAEGETSNDNLSIFDVEQDILSSIISEPQKDKLTSESKYRIKGKTIDNDLFCLLLQFLNL